MITTEKHMQERVAQVFFGLFSAVLHCAELSRNVRQQVQFQNSAKRTATIKQKTNMDECDEYVY